MTGQVGLGATTYLLGGAGRGICPCSPRWALSVGQGLRTGEWSPEATAMGGPGKVGYFKLGLRECHIFSLLCELGELNGKVYMSQDRFK